MDIFLYSMLALLTATLLLAAFCDLTRFTLPNELSWAVAGLFAVTALVEFSMPSVLSHLASGAAVFAVTWALWRLRIMGGGDVKLWAATAFWFELPLLPQQILAVTLTGVVVALVLVALRRGLVHYARATGRDDFQGRLPDGLRIGGPVPYGVAIAVGTLWALFVPAPGYFTGILPVG